MMLRSAEALRGRLWPRALAAAAVVAMIVTAVMLVPRGVGGGPLLALAPPALTITLSAAFAHRRRRATQLALDASRRRRCAPAEDRR